MVRVRSGRGFWLRTFQVVAEGDARQLLLAAPFPNAAKN